MYDRTASVRHYITRLLKSYGYRSVRTDIHGVRDVIVRPPCDCCALLMGFGYISPFGFNMTGSDCLPFPFGGAMTTECFLRPDIKRFCLTFTIGPDRIWFCVILVSFFFSTIIPRNWSMV